MTKQTKNEWRTMKQGLLLMLLAGTLTFYSCSDDDEPAPENPTEVITSATLTFTPTSGGGTPAVASALDADGLGPGNFTQVLTPTLDASTEYSLTMILLDARDPDDTEDITEEVEEEDDEHQFYFVVSGGVFTEDGSNIPGTIYQDQDDNGLPVGLETTWTSGSAGSGTLRVVLKHQPDEKNQASATNRATGLATGDTDFDFTFTINVN
jgi:hypothetical protein